MQDIKIGKTKVPVILVAGAAGVGLILFLVNQKQGATSSGTLGVDQTAADLNSLEELRTRIEGDLQDSQELRDQLRDILDELGNPRPGGGGGGGGNGGVPVTPIDTARPYPTPANPLQPSEIAAPGKDYDPNGLGALVGDVFGPTTTRSGKWIVTENWTPAGTPVAPVQTTPAAPVTKPTGAALVKTLESLPVINGPVVPATTVIVRPPTSKV